MHGRRDLYWIFIVAGPLKSAIIPLALSSVACFPLALTNSVGKGGSLLLRVKFEVEHNIMLKRTLLNSLSGSFVTSSAATRLHREEAFIQSGRSTRFAEFLTLGWLKPFQDVHPRVCIRDQVKKLLQGGPTEARPPKALHASDAIPEKPIDKEAHEVKGLAASGLRCCCCCICLFLPCFSSRSGSRGSVCLIRCSSTLDSSTLFAEACLSVDRSADIFLFVLCFFTCGALVLAHGKSNPNF